MCSRIDVFSGRRGAAALAVVAAALGLGVRFGLDAWLGAEAVALAAVNIVGWFLLGLLSGRHSAGVRRLWLFLLVFGVIAFTSWVSLLTHRDATVGDVVIACIEVAFGMMFAGLGHLATMPRGPDL